MYITQRFLKTVKLFPISNGCILARFIYAKNHFYYLKFNIDGINVTDLAEPRSEFPKEFKKQ